jgi:pimeloyl-ACP methyl ester carboxylesterase
MQSRRCFLAAAICVAVVAVGCSGGGGGKQPDDPLAVAGQAGVFSVSIPASGGASLGGTLSVPPHAKGPVPGVVIVPTTGGVDRDGVSNPTDPDPVYQDLSKAFVDAGMATLRYDRRGIGASKVSGQAITYDNLVSDAKDALKFLMGRKEVGRSPMAVVGHDVGGPIALRVAADEPRVKSVVLVSSPGRPLVDVLADGFAASNGPASADAFRAEVANLLATGSLPGPESIPPEHQSVLGQGQDALLKGMFSDDPAADAARVKVPALIMVSSHSQTVTKADGDRLAQAMGPGASVVVTDATPTLAVYVPDRPAIAFDPNNEATHTGGARIVDPIRRDQGSVAKVTSFLSDRLA